MQNKKEMRMFELRAAEPNEKEMRFHGTAIVFEQETVLYELDGIEYKEIIDRHALDNADMRDVPLKYNHGDGAFPILARTRNGSLTLTKTDNGLDVDGYLLDTSAGRDINEMLRSGLLNKMSFAFTVKNEAYDRQTHTRRVLEIDKLFDVSIVDVPAYEQTDVSARSYCEERAKEEAEAMAKAEEERATAEKAKELADMKAHLLELLNR